MLGPNLIVHKLSVQLDQEVATIICFTHSLDSINKYFSAEFRELGSTISNHGFSIPSDRQATFQEQIRVLGNASDITPIGRINLEDWLTKKMEEAYGRTAKITIERIGN
jgi:hypothetical protein